MVPENANWMCITSLALCWWSAHPICLGTWEFT